MIQIVYFSKIIKMDKQKILIIHKLIYNLKIINVANLS